MNISNVTKILEDLASKTAKKGASDQELYVIEWTAAGALLLHLNVAGAPRIMRFSNLRFDALTTETEKKGAYAQFLAGPERAGRPKTVLCWADGMTFRQLSLPEMPQEDLMKAFDWDLKKKYYFNADENLFGYKEVMSIEGEEVPERLYSVFYCENRTAFPRLDLAITLGLDIRALVPGQAALARFASVLEPTPDKDLLICELVDGLARILVVHEDKNMLVRNVTIATEADGAFTDELLGRVSDELRKTIEFYEGQKYARPIGKAVFVGERCDPTRILDFMTPKLNVPIAVPTLENFISGSMDQADKDFVLSHPSLFASAIGAALMPDDSLNLVPADIKTKNRRGKMDRLLNFGILVLGGFMTVLIALTSVQMNWAHSKLAGMHAEYEKLNENKKVLESMLNRSRVRRSTLKGDVPLYALLKDLSLRTPGMITFQKIQFSRQESTLVISGDVSDLKKDNAKTVAQFAASLTESDFFSTATVTSTEPDEENKVVHFVVTATTKGLFV